MFESINSVSRNDMVRQTVNTWISLPESVIAAETTNCFKHRLDKFWNNQGMIFDYKEELTEIGNRSNII